MDMHQLHGNAGRRNRERLSQCSRCCEVRQNHAGLGYGMFGVAVGIQSASQGQVSGAVESLKPRTLSGNFACCCQDHSSPGADRVSACLHGHPRMSYSRILLVARPGLCLSWTPSWGHLATTPSGQTRNAKSISLPSVCVCASVLFAAHLTNVFQAMKKWRCHVSSQRTGMEMQQVHGNASARDCNGTCWNAVRNMPTPFADMTTHLTKMIFLLDGHQNQKGNFQRPPKPKVIQT